MFKQVSLLRRRPGMSQAEFEAHYEGRHAPLLAAVMPDARRYMRRYLRSEGGQLEAGGLPVPFDCMTELWADSREQFESFTEALAAPEAYKSIYDDEANLFASHDNPLFSVEECDSELRRTPELEALAAGDEPVGILKLVVFARRRQDLTPAEFRHYYETRHRLVGDEALKDALRYVRRYVRPEINPMTGKPMKIGFDALVEIWWKDRAEWDAAKAEMATSGAGAKVYADEENLFETHDNPMVSVEEFDSPMRRWLRR